MLDWIALACLLGALFLLLALAVVDLRTRLLPNEMVLGFATLGVVFHLTTLTAYMSVTFVAAGAVIGFGVLFLIRAAANAYYKADTLGLGDVKLMGAAGLWLGPDMIMMALMIGSLAALAHGVVYAVTHAQRHGKPVALAALQLPAGPGFAVGIVAAGGWLYRDFVAGFLPLLNLDQGF